MKKIIVSICVLLLVAVLCFFGHDYRWLHTSEITLVRDNRGEISLDEYKDGGSRGMHVILKDGKDEVLFLDRRMAYPTPESTRWERKKDGLLYLGYDAMVAGRPLDLSSKLGREYEALLRFERRRWLVRYSYFRPEYSAILDEFASALERTRQADKVPKATSHP